MGDDRGIGFATIDVPKNESPQAVEIIEAAAKGALEEVEAFAENPDLFSCDYDSRTALHLAASNGHLEIVKCILPHATHVFNNPWHLECMPPDARYDECMPPDAQYLMPYMAGGY